MCEFCGWECDDECRACPKCREYKGLVSVSAPWDNNPDLDAKIRAMEADPEYQGREP